MSGRGLTRRFALLGALRWLPVGLTVPVLVLLLSARGLDLAETGRLLAVYSGVTLLLELPTGGLADVVGRRPVLVASSLASALGAVLMAVGTHTAVLVGAAVSMAVGRALGSGPLEAWFVDAARADDGEADIRHGLAGGQTAEEAALGIGAVVGGAIPAWVAATPAGAAAATDALVIPLSVPFLVSAGLFLVHAVAVIALVHERRPATDPGPASQETRGGRAGIAGSVGTTVRDGLRLGRTSSAIRRLLAFSAVLGVALAGVELLSPGHVASLLGGAEAGGAAFGLLVALGFGAGAVGTWLAPRLVRVRYRSTTDGAPDRRDDTARMRERARTWAVGVNLVAAVMVCLIGIPFFGGVATAFILFYLFLGAGGPLIAEMLHDRVGESTRSTMLSLESLTLQAGALVATLTLGALADRVGTWPSLAVVGAVLAVGALLLPRPAPAVDTPQP